MEESAEGYLFMRWIETKKIVPKSELSFMVSAYNYIGALSDLSGEIARHCVAKATGRNIEAVNECLSSNIFLLGEVSCMRLPYKTSGDKLKALRTNTSKLKSILYQLTLLQKNKVLKVDDLSSLKQEKIDDNNMDN